MVLCSLTDIEKHLEMGKQFLSKGQFADALSHYHAAIGTFEFGFINFLLVTSETVSFYWILFCILFHSFYRGVFRGRPNKLSVLLQKSDCLFGYGKVKSSSSWSGSCYRAKAWFYHGSTFSFSFFFLKFSFHCHIAFGYIHIYISFSDAKWRTPFSRFPKKIFFVLSQQAALLNARRIHTHYLESYAGGKILCSKVQRKMHFF